MTTWVLMLAGMTAGDGGLGTGAAREPVAAALDVRLPLVYADARQAARKLTAALGRGNDTVFLADERTNRVLIRASAATVRRAREIVRRLDVKTEFCLHVVPLRNADAAWAAKGVGAVLPLLGCDREVYVTADAGENTVIISTGEEKGEAIRKLLRWIDGQSG